MVAGLFCVMKTPPIGRKQTSGAEALFVRFGLFRG
jgi:hypothetical protein